MRQSENSTEAASTEADTISTLPDDILCRILSSVTTKEAVATSVLSKRWIHVWHFILNLHFSDFKVKTVKSNLLFNKFVYSVLASRDAAGSKFINSFHFDIQYGNPFLANHFGFPSINKWINRVVQCKLKHLHLNFRVYPNKHNLADPCVPKLPNSIFTCTSLVSLNLGWFRVKGFSFSSVEFVGFPSLKTLHLELFQVNEVRDFRLLLAGCPILEDLRVYDIHFYCEQDYLALQEFESLTLPKLTRADIVKCSCSCFMVKAVSTSVSLFIDTSMLYGKDDLVYEVIKMPRLYGDIPIFHNLTHLALHYYWDLVVQVLHQCPMLQNLKLYQELHWTKRNENDDKEDWMKPWEEPEFVPQCLSSCLKTCIIRHFSGLQSELMLAQYILKNAKELQSVTIWSKRESSEIARKLSTCPKASATCQLLVY